MASKDLTKRIAITQQEIEFRARNTVRCPISLQGDSELREEALRDGTNKANEEEHELQRIIKNIKACQYSRTGFQVRLAGVQHTAGLFVAHKNLMQIQMNRWCLIVGKMTDAEQINAYVT